MLSIKGSSYFWFVTFASLISSGCLSDLLNLKPSIDYSSSNFPKGPGVIFELPETSIEGTSVYTKETRIRFSISERSDESSELIKYYALSNSSSCSAFLSWRSYTEPVELVLEGNNLSYLHFKSRTSLGFESSCVTYKIYSDQLPPEIGSIELESTRSLPHKTPKFFLPTANDNLSGIKTISWQIVRIVPDESTQVIVENTASYSSQNNGQTGWNHFFTNAASYLPDTASYKYRYEVVLEDYAGNQTSRALSSEFVVGPVLKITTGETHHKTFPWNQSLAYVTLSLSRPLDSVTAHIDYRVQSQTGLNGVDFLHDTTLSHRINLVSQLDSSLNFDLKVPLLPKIKPPNQAYPVVEVKIVGAENVAVLDDSFSFQVVDSRPNLPTTTLAQVRDFDLSIDLACAVTQQNKLYCWGNKMKQLFPGQSGLYAWELPAPPSPIRSFAQNKGDKIFCWTDQDYYIWCIGENSFGLLGSDNPNQFIATPRRISNIAGNFLRAKKVVTSYTTACAQGLDDKLYCWGQNAPSSNNARLISATSNWNTIFPHYTEVSTLVSGAQEAIRDFDLSRRSIAYAYEDSSHSRLRIVSAYLNSTPVDIPKGPGTASITQITTHNTTIPPLDDDHETLCYRLSNHKVFCSGFNLYQQRGLEDTLVTRSNWNELSWIVPELAPSEREIASVFFSGFTLFVTTTQGRTVSVGYNWLKNPPAPEHNPYLITRRYSKIDAVAQSVCGLNVVSSQLECWGQETNQLQATGIDYENFFKMSHYPIRDKNLYGTAPGATLNDVHLLDGAICVLNDRKEVFCWGDGSQGYIGQGALFHRLPSQRFNTLQLADWLISSNSSICALSEGELKCWGRDNFSQFARREISYCQTTSSYKLLNPLLTPWTIHRGTSPVVEKCPEDTAIAILFGLPANREIRFASMESSYLCVAFNSLSDPNQDDIFCAGTSSNWKIASPNAASMGFIQINLTREGGEPTQNLRLLNDMAYITHKIGDTSYVAYWGNQAPPNHRTLEDFLLWPNVKIQKVSTWSSDYCALASNHQVFCGGRFLVPNNNPTSPVTILDSALTLPNSSDRLQIKDIGLTRGMGCAVGLNGHLYCWGPSLAMLGISNFNPNDPNRVIDLTESSSPTFQKRLFKRGFVKNNDNLICAIDEFDLLACFGLPYLGHINPDTFFTTPVPIGRYGP